MRFMHALVEAVRRTEPGAGIGEEALALVRLDGSVSPDAVAALTADLDVLEQPLVIVVDDLHLAGAAVVDALEMLVEYKPAHVQFVVATRIEPSLRLERMRVTGELAEVRDTDLSFTAVETEELLDEFGVCLPGPELALLHQRTEGWVAGLQMAALSMQASPDPLEALGRVGLPTQTIVDYFVREVLERQSDEIADFMLSTSILDVLSIDRCVALCGEGSGAILDQLDRAHLFVVSVGEQRPKYRYHHLIRDVLARATACHRPRSGATPAPPRCCTRRRRRSRSARPFGTCSPRVIARRHSACCRAACSRTTTWIPRSGPISITTTSIRRCSPKHHSNSWR